MSCGNAVLTTACEGSVLSTCTASQAAWYLATAMHLLRLVMFKRVANFPSRPNLVAASTISCLSAFSVNNLTTKLTSLFNSRVLPLYCYLMVCIQASTCSVVTLCGRLSFKELLSVSAAYEPDSKVHPRLLCAACPAASQQANLLTTRTWLDSPC